MSVTGLPTSITDALGALANPGRYGGDIIRDWEGRDSVTERRDLAEVILTVHANLRQLALNGIVHFERTYHKGLVLGWLLGVKPMTVYEIWAGARLVATYIRISSLGHKQDSVQLTVH